MSLTAATLLLPAPDTSWRIWEPRAESAGAVLERPAEIDAKVKPLIIGLPATACRTVGLVLPNADHSVLEQIIVTQLERRGLKPNTAANRNFRWHLLTQTASTATVSVDVLAEPFPPDLALDQASDYTSALRLVTLPHGHMIITEEHGSLVLAVGYQGKLYHSHLFAPATATPQEIALEIMLSRLALENDLGVGTITGVDLIGSSWDRVVAEDLTHLAGMPVRLHPQLPPTPDLDTQHWTKMLPSSVRSAQTARGHRQKLLRFGVLGGGVALALGILAFFHLNQLERQAAALAAEVEQTSEPAARARRTAERWMTLVPAIEPKRYPIYLLAEVTKLMPPSGIVIREFEVRGNEIDIRGEARDAQVAFQFVEDLQKHKVLGRYVWSKPQPTVREKTAVFRAQGKAP